MVRKSARWLRLSSLNIQFRQQQYHPLNYLGYVRSQSGEFGTGEPTALVGLVREVNKLIYWRILAYSFRSQTGQEIFNCTDLQLLQDVLTVCFHGPGADS